jgi:gluconolactonase
MQKDEKAERCQMERKATDETARGERILLLLFALGVALLALLDRAPVSAAAQPNAAPVKIQRFDPRFDELVPRDAVVEKLADGFAWVEGPVWNRAGRFLLFSDVPNNSIFRWKPDEGISLFLKPSGYTGSAPFTGKEPGSNGLAYDAQGRLIFCQHGDRSISRLEKNGARTALVSRYQGKRINSPNDVIVRSNGDLYFTDPPFGLPKAFDDPAKELDFCGVYRVKPDGTVTLLTRDMIAPNGIGFSPDEKTLYVADSRRTAWFAFDVQPDGSLANRRVLLDASERLKGRPGVADGLKVDARGNLFAAAPGGIIVIAPDGTILGSFEFGVATGNCAWGEDGSTLFVASNTAIYRIRLRTKGAGF